VAQREFIKTLLALLATLFVISCVSRDQRDYEKAEALLREKNYSAAINIFDQIIALNEGAFVVEAAKEGARVAQLNLKDFKKAIKYLETIVLVSENEEDRHQAQKQIALLYFDQLADYKKATEELNKTVLFLTNEEEKNDIRFKLAKAYYFAGKFNQSESEDTVVLTTTKDPALLYQAILLKGNIYLAEKNIPKAIFMFNDLFDKFPERAVKENSAMTLAVAYEEMKDYKSAIAILEKMKKYHTTPEYIDMRINKLLEAQRNLPGARGKHKK
jgi:tetratricopeptide (TPR) repeat protein